MVENNPQTLDALFHALSDPTRRSMLQALARQPHKVGELAAPFEMSLAAASKHIKVLEHAGLVRREISGRTHTCHLEAMPMHAGLEWIRHYERFWNSRLDALEALLRADDAARPVPAPVPPQRRKRKKKE
ncbi:ArsR/SmtB family transcription factor [Marilutibacter alkalisoli]|uniref:Winged helix-turn-helix transcriptional regulator n=1 Tax=Marilutibacter alkalisoli TaxID=2591633 RepID=A0A514BSF5_9GAMM|nr:metalloregulator ArsR/SmtB family transcription factor [Lysobacter alkalisoli]QDH70255.1 winged helix-turn-helix transcriptional regulator [Lysobacter alkalisoli]